MPNVIEQFRAECIEALDAALSSTYPESSGRQHRFTIPGSLEFGELASSVAHEIARQEGHAPQDVARKIRGAIKLNGKSLIAGVEDAAGYINFRLNYTIAGPLILNAVNMDDETYGLVRVPEPLRISVEHTSSNPAGPVTMATARNSILGDALARLCKARGHSVIRRFYVDDVGRQVSILAYGYNLLNRPEPEGKPDHWFGRLYACTNCAVQIEVTKRKLKMIRPDQSDVRTKLQDNLDEWVGIAAELESLDKELLGRVVKMVQGEDDPESAIQELGRKYEQNDKEVSTLIRTMVERCVEGIRASLHEIGIDFDKWDWESQLLWDGLVKKTLSRLAQLPFTKPEDASLVLDPNAIVEAYSLRKQFGLSPNYEVPSLTLVRSDGTTLYSTRDIAYSIVKFNDSDRVINVIASEQNLPQLQIRLALYGLGEKEAAFNMVHYAYGLVELPGVKMSKRRAHFITLDEVVEQAKVRVNQTLAERKQEIGSDESLHIIRDIAYGAVKFAMLSVNSAKNLMFTWDRVLSLERNSAPFINYAYTRAGSILRKLGKTPNNPDCSLLNHPLEHVLLFKIAQLPEAFCEAADQLKPEELATYATAIAEKFHEYYEKVDVIHVDEQVKNARAALVASVQVVLRNSMELLGINLSERM
ncbi:MAG: arginine--tRNA ligase [Candidatus Bathyarchaeia archaeon]